MRSLHIDIETYCELNLKDVGMHAYASSPTFEIILMAYAYDDEDVKIVDFAQGEELPKDVLHDLCNPNILKIAHNASFEMACLKAKGFKISFDQWFCTLTLALMAGYPASLGGVSEAIGLSEEEAKMKVGKQLIKYFCLPCVATLKNGGRTRNLPRHDMEKWNLFKEYCIRDVEAERLVDFKLSREYLMHIKEKDIWILDQEINARGVKIDVELAKSAIVFEAEQRKELEKEAVQISKIKNVNSVSQLREWLNLRGVKTDSLDKKSVEKLLGSDCALDVKRVLEIRQQLSKTSVKKYTAMLNAVCNDGRVKGLFQYYGASRTGRWAGRLVQVQNLPRSVSDDGTLEFYRNLLKVDDYERLDLWTDVNSALSELIRTAFIAEENHSFIVADFSAIEARVIAWLAGEKWLNDVFATHGKIYEAQAAQMFKIPIEEVSSDMRARGKVATLALGYQGASGALIAMGALEMGLKEEELAGIVSKWRNANKHIVQLWRDVEKSAKSAIETGYPIKLKNLIFTYTHGNLYIRLPSGRRLAYVKTCLQNGKMKYKGTDVAGWNWQDTYGGKLVENITQAIARDCLAEAMLKMQYPIVMHVHDEIVLEVKDEELENANIEVLKVMRCSPEWAKSLKLETSIFASKYYKK